MPTVPELAILRGGGAYPPRTFDMGFGIFNRKYLELCHRKGPEGEGGRV